MRNTRYQTKSNPPPNLEAVLKVLGKESPRRLLAKAMIRGLAQRVDRVYGDKGKADDLFRFLVNCCVLLKDPVSKRFCFDSDRALYILGCSQQGIDPDALPDEFDNVARINQLHSVYQRRPVPVVPVADATVDATGPAAVQPGPAISQQGGVVETMQVATRSPSSGPRSPTEVRQAPAAGLLQRIAYLIPVEVDLWESLCIAEDGKIVCGERRIGVPNTPQGLFKKFAGGSMQRSHAADEYVAALRRLAEARIISLVEESGGRQGSDHACYRFPIDPDSIKVVPIGQRLDKRVNQRYLDAIHWVELELDRTVLIGRGWSLRFLDAARRQFPELNAATLQLRFSCYRPASQFDGWGIFVHGPDGQLLVCLPGLEPYNFLSDNKPLRRCRRPEKPALAAPEVPAVVSPSSSPISSFPAPAALDDGAAFLNTSLRVALGGMLVETEDRAREIATAQAAHQAAVVGLEQAIEQAETTLAELRKRLEDLRGQCPASDPDLQLRISALKKAIMVLTP